MNADGGNTEMNILFNNDSSKQHSTDDMKNNDFTYISNCDEPIETERLSDLDEFEQILSEYTEKHQNADNNTEARHLNTRNKSVVTETVFEMGKYGNNCNPKQEDINLNEYCINNFQITEMSEYFPKSNALDNVIKEEELQSIKTEVDRVTLNSNGGINVNEIDQNSDLEALTNIFSISNENKSIEIEIDTKNGSTESIINDSFLETDFSEAGPSRIHYVNFDYIELNDENPFDFVNGADNNEDEHYSDVESNYSFHSSDFELITEDEAKMDGLIIHFRQQNEINDENAYNNDNIIEMCLPGPSNDYTYRENHRIPEGDEFFNMFHGIYAPANIPDLIFLENKSVVPSQCMNVDNDKFGFDIAALNMEVFNEEYQDEAKETTKKILNTYHGDNERKRRRRPL